MNKYDTIEVVEKGVDEIVEVEKFNPFHDSAGKFSSSNGFKTYSANPNTKAGAMAIARSAAAGHGTTANVHRESYGETIRQNANWIGRGKQQSSRQQAAATLRNRVEPIAGLMGASAAGASWQYQNAQQGRTTKPGKQPAQQAQQQPQKPAPKKQPQPQQQQQTASGSLDADVANVKLSSGDKLAIQPRDMSNQVANTKSVAKNNYQEYVAGKDISQSADLTKAKGSKEPIDMMAEMQGWNKAPTVTNNLETFQKAAKQSGQLLIRSVDRNYQTGQSAEDVCKSTMSDGNSPLGGHGGKVYGTGMYMVGASTTITTGRALGRHIAAAQNHSFAYAGTQMMATVHPKAKIATPTQTSRLKNDWLNMSASAKRRFKNDVGAYIASKGYDGAQHHTRTNSPYITMYNKSALIFYSGVATR